jgi:hypothetical protein
MRFNNPTRVMSILAAAMLIQQSQAGPVAYGLCQAGCAGVVVACYSAAGLTFGTVAAAAAPAVVLQCNVAQGTCYATCAALLLAPTP